MSLVRYPAETQRAFVERVLREDGRIAVYDVLWDTTTPDGKKAAITRLASIIWTLRHERGWAIDTIDESGQIAVYVLTSAPADTRRPSLAAGTAVIHVPEQPEWTRQWTCTDCGGRPASQPFGLLGDMGRAHCGTCRRTTYFKSRRAA